MSLDAMIAAQVRAEVAKQLGALRVGMTTEHVTTATAAQVADASPATIRRWVREGLIQASGEGKRLRIDRASLDAFLASPRPKRQTDLTASPEALADRRVRGVG